MQRSLREWPIRFKRRVANESSPDITFLIPFRGCDRIPALMMTIKSILAQRDISVECLVVEQSQNRELDGLPQGVRYIHLPHAEDPSGWYKSWAFNVGVKAATADIVVCHDGDILVPSDYGCEILKFIRDVGYEVVHLQRFLFCLNRENTERLIDSKSFQNLSLSERVRQNWQGGTLAIKKESFFKIGGYDESFVGWGGEDNEFYDRCTILSIYDYGYLPFVHLWHEPQEQKYSQERERNLKHMRELLDQPPPERIAQLKARQSLVGFRNQISARDSLHG